MNDRHPQETELRIDKWLWAQRPSRAAKIALNGVRPKPNQMIRAGDFLNSRRDAYEWTIVVKGTSYRGPQTAFTLQHERSGLTRSARRRCRHPSCA
jgi:ribosomal 50S subunit-recycling heat shock protein